jgi:hypothetical protein
MRNNKALPKEIDRPILAYIQYGSYDRAVLIKPSGKCKSFDLDEDYDDEFKLKFRFNLPLSSKKYSVTREKIMSRHKESLKPTESDLALEKKFPGSLKFRTISGRLLHWEYL